MDENHHSIRLTSQSRISYAESDGSIPSPDNSPSKHDYRDDGGDEEEFDDEEQYVRQSNESKDNGLGYDGEEEDDDTGYAPAAQERNSRGYSLRAKPNVSLKGSESAQTKMALNLKPKFAKTKRAPKGSYGKVGRPTKGSTPKGNIPLLLTAQHLLTSIQLLKRTSPSATSLEITSVSSPLLNANDS